MTRQRESAETGQKIRTVRLDDDELNAILDKLDKVDTAKGLANKEQRRTPRYRYRVKNAIVHMQQPGSGGALPFQVPTRNLGASGLAFVHGGFIHPKTRCVVQLITSHGTWNDVPGSVVYCDYVDNNIHAVALEFDRDIEPAEYCPDAIQCRLLFAEDDPATTRMTNFHLQQLGVTVDHVPDGRQAVEKALQVTYDALLLDMEMPELDGFGVARELRGKGYTGLIVAATGMTGTDDKQRCLDAGCDRYLPKPYSYEDLAQLVQSMHGEPLFSTMAGDVQLADLIDGFVEEMPKQVRMMEQSLNDSHIDGLIRSLRQLKSQGASFGFEVLSEKAVAIENRLMDGQPVEDVLTEVRSLIRLCQQARGTKRR